ncbi:leucine-rich repeat domain-containing protein [Beggiatoa leptomitoformis]|uniref:leucine-rich repeat domain-containing protein n=1 Tax=Beggiatoa leptomitoformis TaxID=288004 RepID=UPI001375AD6F|nr:leucine-rich repeat domain-containing protein [Beggiatoa leptomitoformis]
MTEIPPAECESLLQLYNSTNGDNWENNNGWNETNTPCSWVGVSCDSGHVTTIYLKKNQLTGSIPDLSHLPNLTVLWLYANQLTGSIPDFSHLPNLTTLSLGANQLTGSIPDFSHLPNLTYLSLYSNQLTGGIPDFSHLPNLTDLWLDSNQLTGSIPDFSHLPNLTVLWLNTNQLTGSIPDFSHLPNLTELNLGLNQLTGSIPDFSHLPNLTELNLGLNQLTGSIPDFSHLPNLTELWLDSNQLTGSIPDFSHLPNLTALRLNTNRLTGSIPDFSHLPNLTELWLDSNQLTGSIPDFSHLPNLTALWFDSNQLTGSIPDFSHLPNLTELRFYSNQLTGSIPDFSHLPNLTKLWLSFNQLTGSIPDFSHLPNLTRLYLNSNQLTGSIPNFSHLPNLIDLWLDSNQLTGSIPDFSHLPNLIELGLGGNKLTGSIPDFSHLPNLMELGLSFNQLTGSIPDFSHLPKLTYLNLAYNQLTGTIPNLAFSSFYVIYLHYNCGLIAFDSNQQTVLTGRNAEWQQQNDNCPIVTPTSIVVGNVSITATSPIQSNVPIQGNVILAKTGGNDILKVVNGQVTVDIATSKITGQGKIIALGIKSNPYDFQTKDIPIYSGAFTIDAVENPPVLILDPNGLPLLRMVQDVLPATLAPNRIIMENDKVTLKDALTNLTTGYLNLGLILNNIVLSQDQDSSQEAKFSATDYLKFKPVKLGNFFTLTDFEASYNFLTGAAGGKAEVTFYADRKISAEATINTKPLLCIDKLGLGFGVGESLFTLPPAPPYPFGAAFDGFFMSVDKLCSFSYSQLKYQGTGKFYLTDALGVISGVEKSLLRGYFILNGEVSIVIDMSGKIELAGNLKLLEHVPLGNAKIVIGNPTSIEGNTSLLDVMTGRVYLSVGQDSNTGVIEGTGMNRLSINLPELCFDYTGCFGPYSVDASAVDITIRVSPEGVYYIARIPLNRWISTRIDCNPTDPTGCHLFAKVRGFDEVQLRNLRAATSTNANFTFTIDKPSEYVAIQLAGQNAMPLFKVTLPNGDVLTPETTPTLMQLVNGESELAFGKDVAAKKSTYTLMTPSVGTYTIEVTNINDVGEYTFNLAIPTAQPTIQLTSLTTDEIWDKASPVNITWQADNLDIKSKISLYYADNKEGKNANIIALDLSSTTNSYLWQVPNTVQPSKYYIYAKIDNLVDMPIYGYSAGMLEIGNTEAPATPQDVIATAVDGGINIQWTPSTNTDIAGYRIFVSDKLDSQAFDHEFGIGMANSYELRGLTNGRTYQVAIAAVNATNLLKSASSQVLQVTPTGQAQGNTTATNATGQTNPSLSVFGVTTVTDGEFVESVQQEISDKINLRAEMTVDFADVGKVADLVVFAAYKATPDAQEQYYSLSQPNELGIASWNTSPTVISWNGNPSTLPALSKSIILQPQTSLEMYTGHFVATGELKVYVGYRLSDGTLVTNTKPVDISVISITFDN